jgi:Protein of unknown function (DUF2809)
MKRIQFSKNYFSFFLLLLAIEVGIALFIHDQFIRPYIGDFLVVILLYCLLKSFVNISPIKAALFVLTFAYTIEFLQWFNIADIMGIQNRALRIIIGNSFSWGDLIAYTVGIALVLQVERKKL